MSTTSRRCRCGGVRAAHAMDGHREGGRRRTHPTSLGDDVLHLELTEGGQETILAGVVRPQGRHFTDVRVVRVVDGAPTQRGDALTDA